MQIKLKHGTARVDRADDALVRPFTWCSVASGKRVYATARIAGRNVYMHQLILGHIGGGKGKLGIDHVNGDGLDNRRQNLRLATPRQNAANGRPRRGTSRYKGVSRNRKLQKWQAHIMVNRKSRYLGVYVNERDAAVAYDRAAREAWGAFARVNFP